MKGTILDFLKLASEKPELAKDLVELATKHDFEFTDEVSDEALDGVSGGLVFATFADASLLFSQLTSILNASQDDADAMSAVADAMGTLTESAIDLCPHGNIPAKCGICNPVVSQFR